MPCSWPAPARLAGGTNYRLRQQDLPGLYGWREGGGGRNQTHPGGDWIPMLRGCGSGLHYPARLVASRSLAAPARPVIGRVGRWPAAVRRGPRGLAEARCADRIQRPAQRLWARFSRAANGPVRVERARRSQRAGPQHPLTVRVPGEQFQALMPRQALVAQVKVR